MHPVGMLQSGYLQFSGSIVKRGTQVHGAYVDGTLTIKPRLRQSASSDF